ncbi:ABC transporter permease [Streptosporangium sp. KLBMP 9127]|nr:ABC transporter permease [Streptosporangium sp. KLBMP 9127]
MMIILAKDLWLRSRDSTLLVYAVVLPLGLAFMFNLVLGGGGGDRLGARYGVADQDRGPAATRFVTGVLRPMAAQGLITLHAVTSREEGRSRTERGELDAVFVIPEGFSAAVGAGRATTLEVVGDVDAPIAVQVAREAAQAYATELRSLRLASPDGTARDLPPAPLTLVDDASAVTRQLDTTTYHAAGMAVFFLFFAVMFGATGILDERSAGTLARLLAAPVSRHAILAGKLLGGVVAAVAGMAILVVASTLLLGARWGDPLGVAALVVAGVLAVTGLTGAVAAFSRTSEEASNRLSGLAMVLGLFGGALFPVAQLGGFAAVASLTPHHWFLRGLADLAGGGSAGEVLVPVAVLLCFAVLGGALATVRIGRLMRV